MDMTLPVTLIVKAPNQQIEDQTVKCELTWTISKLKGHLSEVYPSKPARDEQKLIYSGQLLSDTVVLKDVLRNYDEQNTHTVHLVCTPSRNSSYKFESSPKPKPPNQPEMVSTTHTSVPEQSSSSSSAASASSTLASNVQTSTTGLRQRHNNSGQETMTDFQTMWSTFAQPQANFVDPTQYAVQMSLFQQAYAQYINQYMQMVTNQVPPIRTDNLDEQEAAAAAPEPINGPELIADDQEDDIQVDRDWLDWFYVFSRVLILFCIVYFYSSPLRFAFVLLLGFGLYLYQMGYFRVQNVNNNEAARRPQENNNVAAAPAQQQQQQQQQQDQATNNQNADAVIIEQRPTMLTIMWTFFTTFFASLIPEIPNAV